MSERVDQRSSTEILVGDLATEALNITGTSWIAETNRQLTLPALAKEP